MKRWFQIVLVTVPLSSIVSGAIVVGLERFAPPPLVKDAAAERQQSVGTAQDKSNSSDLISSPLRQKFETPEHEPWWATLVEKIAWPFSVLIALMLIAWNGHLRRIFGVGSRLVRKIKAGGIEMEISSDAVDEVRQQLRGSFRDLVGSARNEYERMADLQDIDRRLAAVIEREVLKELDDTSNLNLRATIHVRDIVFRDYLYQFVDYYPKGGGAHRRFSQRYGIIGRSWRSGMSHGTGNAFGSSASEESLVEQWGMTKDETHGMLNSRKSCLSVLLRSGGIEIGILYIDSTVSSAFGDNGQAQQYAFDLEQKALVKELAAAVERALAPLRAAGPNLDIKELGR